MMNALEPLFPALQTLEPWGLAPSSLSGWFAYANEVQAARLARLLEDEFLLIGQEFAAQVDHTYLRSDAFRANVVQAVRAAEVAESEGKLRLIARALASCTLSFPAPMVDKFQTMRLIEQLSEREWTVLAGLISVLDPIDPFSDVVPVNVRLPLDGFSRAEGEAALLGLQQLGLLLRETQPETVDEWRDATIPARNIWKLSPLARQVVLLGRLGGGTE